MPENDGQGRKATTRTGMCEDCYREFTYKSSGKRRFCDACKKERTAENNKRSYERLRIERIRVESVMESTCEKCGVVFVYKSRNKKKLCKECFYEAMSEQRRKAGITKEANLEEIKKSPEELKYRELSDATVPLIRDYMKEQKWGAKKIARDINRNPNEVQEIISMMNSGVPDEKIRQMMNNKLRCA